VVRKVAEALNSLKKPLPGSKILIIGVAYKRNTDDVRESPALEIIHLLKAAGATVEFCDPFVAELAVNGSMLPGRPLDVATLSESDCVLVVTDHTSVDYAFVAEHAPIVVDTRNAMRNVVGRHIVRL
jgi:UDP-N-acetyl-D-glucosamine dehydrogenase